MQKLFQQSREMGYQLQVDLQQQDLTLPDGDKLSFEIDGFRKHCLLNGLDDIDLTLEHVKQIKEYEDKRRNQTPWLFGL